MSRGFIIVAAFALCALSYSLLIPPGEAPDEPAHLKYAGYISETGDLPGAEFIESDSIPEAFQPPLYHGLLAGLIEIGAVDYRIGWVGSQGFERSAFGAQRNEFDARATRAATVPTAMRGFYVARMFSVVLGIIFVVLCLKLVGAAGLVPLAMLTIVPAFVFASGTLGNDVIAGVWSAAALLAFQRWRKNESLTSLLFCALFFGLGMLTKLTVLFLWVPLLAIELIRTRSTKRYLSPALLFAIPLAISLIAIERSIELHPHRLDPDRLAWIQSGAIPWLFSWVSTLAKTLYHTLFTSVGVLGAHAVWLQGWVYGIFVLVALSIVPVAIRDLHRSGKKLATEHTAFLSSVLATFGLFFASVYLFRESGECMHARLFIPFVPGLLLGFTKTDFTRFSIRSEWRLQLWIVLFVSGFVAVLPREMLLVAAKSIANLLHGTSDPAHYAEVLRRIAQIIAICSLGFLFLQRESVRQKVESSLPRSASWIAVLGLAFNILLLLFYVRPILSK